MIGSNLSPSVYNDDEIIPPKPQTSEVFSIDEQDLIIENLIPKQPRNPIYQDSINVDCPTTTRSTLSRPYSSLLVLKGSLTTTTKFSIQKSSSISRNLSFYYDWTRGLSTQKKGKELKDFQ